MKNTLVMAGLALGLAVSPLSFAKDVKPVTGNFVTVTTHCAAGYKFHRVKVAVFKKFNKGGFMVYKRLRCNTTRTINF
jgi:hypothetical protein